MNGSRKSQQRIDKAIRASEIAMEMKRERSELNSTAAREN